ncbi:MAG: ATP-binding protein [Cyclobacteriaceae bacterium]
MVRHIKVFKKHKGVNNLELNNLEKINVICGKNSSGKSSILEGINLRDHAYVGLEISDTDKEKLVELYNTELRNKTSDQTAITVGTKYFTSNYDKVFLNKTILYEDTIKILLYKFDEIPIHNHRFPDKDLSALERTLEQYLLKKVKRFDSILISPKRHLESEVRIDFGRESQPNGEGVINHLFYLKNQDIGSKDYEIYHRIHSAFEKITGFKVNIVPNKSSLLAVNFYIGNIWLTADQCGLGLSDLLIIITLVIATNYNIYLVEEPENHLHADFQKKLLRFFQEQNKQFILSTHSDVFIDINAVDKIYYAWYLDGEVSVSDQTTKSKIISDLGYSVSEKLVSDAIILVEGPTDIPVIKKLMEWIGTLTDFNVRFWPLGGDIMAELDLSIFSGSESIFTIVDQDPKSKSVRDKYLRNCKEHGIQSHQLERYSLENYLSLAAIKQVFPNQLSTKLTKLEPNVKVDDQLGFSNKKKTIKGKMLAILEKVNKKDIEETDLYQFLQEVDTRLREKSSTPT